MERRVISSSRPVPVPVHSSSKTKSPSTVRTEPDSSSSSSKSSSGLLLLEVDLRLVALTELVAESTNAVVVVVREGGVRDRRGHGRGEVAGLGRWKKKKEEKVSDEIQEPTTRMTRRARDGSKGLGKTPCSFDSNSTERRIKLT